MKAISRLFGFLAVLPLTAHAFQPLITDDTGTQGQGGNQIEAGYARTTDTLAGAKAVTREIPLVFTRGISDALDIYGGATHQNIAPPAPGVTESGWGNPVLGAKWRFYENDASRLSFAIRPELQLPVSESREARGLGTARASYGLALLMTQETGFGSVLANVAVERTNYRDDALNAAERRTVTRFSVAPVWDVAAHWKLALDAGIMTNPDPAEKRRMAYVEFGAIYSPGKDLDFALGVIRNASDGDVRTTAVTMGVTWRFQ